MKTRFFAAAVLGAALAACPPAHAAQATALKSDWQLHSVCDMNDTGERISNDAYRPSGWMKANVPSTVVAAQVASGQFKDIFFGTNLRNLPGMTYPIGENFSNKPMAADSPYHCGWWYRTEFSLPASKTPQRHALRFAGINYSAEIWVNGKRIADRNAVRGAYRTYEFDITDHVHTSGRNTLAVQVFSSVDEDLGINWIDWTAMPPGNVTRMWVLV